jgi:hypothetical protein
VWARHTYRIQTRELVTAPRVTLQYHLNRLARPMRFAFSTQALPYPIADAVL